MNSVCRGVMTIALMALSITAFATSSREDIHDSADQVQPLLPGMSAPEFNVKDARGQAFHYIPAEYGKPVVLSFYRGGWCPYCNLHLSEMRHAEEQLKAMGFDIWFISIDKPELLYESLDNPDTAHTIYSDSSLDATRSFGLAFRVDDATNERYLGYGIDLEGASGETHHVLPAPATYIIGSDGIINFAYINPDYKVRLHPEVLMAAARAYKGDVDKRLVQQRKKNRNK